MGGGGTQVPGAIQGVLVVFSFRVGSYSPTCCIFLEGTLSGFPTISLGFGIIVLGSRLGSAYLGKLPYLPDPRSLVNDLGFSQTL